MKTETNVCETEDMRVLRVDKCHLPWYVAELEEEKDERFNIGSFLLYCLLVYGADGYGRYDGSLRDLYRIFPGGCPTGKEAVIELANRLHFLFERPLEYKDAYIIRPTENTPDLSELTTSKPLHLKIIKRKVNSARNFFYIKGESLRSIFATTDRRCAAPVFQVYLYLISNMFPLRYVSNTGQSKNGFYNASATHKKICAALELSAQQVDRHIARLRDCGLIGYIPGEYGRDSIVTNGNDPRLLEEAKRQQEAFYMKHYGGLNSKYYKPYRGRKGPC